MMQLPRMKYWETDDEIGAIPILDKENAQFLPKSLYNSFLEQGMIKKIEMPNWDYKIFITMNGYVRLVRMGYDLPPFCDLDEYKPILRR